MKKSIKLLSAALIALASFVPAQAATLLVNDGTATSKYSPIDTYDFDVTDLRVQTIYPEAQVAEMAGTFIKSMKFYIATEGGCVVDGINMGVYLGTTNQTGFGSYGATPIEGLTHVADITLTAGETEVLVEFDTPFAYDGGNLVVETTKPGEGPGSVDMYFYGEANNTNYNVIMKRTWSNATESFYPKTTFEYEALENLAILSTRQLAFGSLYPEQTATQTFTLKNAGQNAFTPVFGGLEAPYSIAPAAAEIASGETVEYTVTFAPAAVGEFAQNLTIDCGAAGQFQVAISGACVEVPAEIVVCDGESTSSNLPVYGLYYDEAYQGQMIYPAAELTELAGKTINRVTFHPSQALSYKGGKVQLSFKAVDVDGFTSYDLLTDFTVVATVEPNEGDTELTFVLAEPYKYEGGNLAIECMLIEKGRNYPTIYYYGKNMENYPSLFYYGNSNNSGVSHFLPKATFGYVKEDTPEPQGLRGDVNDDERVDINDVTDLIDYLLNSETSVINADSANVNLDEAININDVTDLIDYLLNGEWPDAE